ncbi:MAG TPA: hypothetical protein VGL19_03830, partial [Polyangiaceae bacterium]
MVKDRLSRAVLAGLAIAALGAFLAAVGCSTAGKAGASGSHPDAPAGGGSMDSSGGDTGNAPGTGGLSIIVGGGSGGMSDCNGVSGCGPTMKVPVCGDGVLDPGELCDDGNTVAGDG